MRATPFLLTLLACTCLATSQALAIVPRKNSTAAILTTLPSIQPAKLGLVLNLNIDGKLGLQKACPAKLNATCTKPILQAEKDSVKIKYSLLPGFTANTTDHVMLKACYAPVSQLNRPWRKASPIIAKSKTCKFVIKKGLSPSAGNATWAPNVNVPSATYFIRAYVMRNASDNGVISKTTSYQVAYGDSALFKVNMINTRPVKMKIAAAIGICLGPLLFGTYFAVTFLGKPKV